MAQVFFILFFALVTTIFLLTKSAIFYVPLSNFYPRTLFSSYLLMITLTDRHQIRMNTRCYLRMHWFLTLPIIQIAILFILKIFTILLVVSSFASHPYHCSFL